MPLEMKKIYGRASYAKKLLHQHTFATWKCFDYKTFWGKFGFQWKQGRRATSPRGEPHQIQSCSSWWSAERISQATLRGWGPVPGAWSCSWMWLAETLSCPGWFSPHLWLVTQFVQNKTIAPSRSSHLGQKKEKISEAGTLHLTRFSCTQGNIHNFTQLLNRKSLTLSIEGLIHDPFLDSNRNLFFFFFPQTREMHLFGKVSYCKLLQA